MGADYIGTMLEFPRKKDETDFDPKKVKWEAGEKHLRKMDEVDLWNSLINSNIIYADYDVSEADLPEMREEFGNPMEYALESLKYFRDVIDNISSDWNIFIGYKTFIFTTGEWSYGDSVESVQHADFLYRSGTAKALGFVDFKDWK